MHDGPTKQKPGSAAKADTGRASLFSGIFKAPAIRNKSALWGEYNEALRGAPPRERLHGPPTMPVFFPRLLAASLLCIVLCALLGTAGAQTAAPAAPVDIDTSLDRIRQQVDTAQRSLANADKLVDADLQTLRSAAQAAQQQATDIADQLAPQLAGIDARVAELGTPAAGAKEDADVASQRALLSKSRGTLDSQLKLARLLTVENQQLAAQLGTLRRSQFQARLGERTNSILGTAFWSELREDLPTDLARIAKLGGELTSAARDTPIAVWLLAPLVIVGIGWTLAFARSRAVRWLTTRAPSGRLRRSLHALLVLLQWTLAIGIAGVVFFAVLDWNDKLPAATATSLGVFAAILWLGGFVFGLANALLCASRPSWRLLPIPDEVATRLRAFPALIAFVTVAAWLAERIAATTNVGLSTTVAVNCIVALAIGLTVVLALMRGERVWRLELAKEGARSRPTWLAVVAGLNWLVLATAVVCLLAGYVAFGSFAVKQVVWAGIVLGTAYLIAALVDDALMAWLATGHCADDAPAPGPRAPQTSAQIAVLLSGLLRLALALVALMLLLAPFGEGPTDLLRRSGQWTQGIAIGEFSLQPAAVLQALLVLVVGLGVVRLLRSWLADRYLPTTALDAGMRTSATSLFGYAGVVVAIALAMSAMGVGLERIAWVASALSVGIGFGLQAVVQNFVSGLILLAERPVKVGDWVSLAGVEGDIRRINVRATEIQMGDRSTVIVPNSEFITKIVRNVTLADPLGLVQIKLPVPLGSDVETVRDQLLQAFDANTDVLDTPGPAVLLDGIDHGQLMFNATGYVSSPRNVARVRSALLFDVLKRLADAGITLSSPPTMLISAAAPVVADPNPMAPPA
jgi:potassium efflux system protein